MTHHIREMLRAVFGFRWFRRRNRRKGSKPSMLAMSMAEFNSPPKHGIHIRRERV